MEFPEILIGGLWHTTNIDNYQKIKNMGFILVDPDIPNKERWHTSGGEKHYPFVRHLGGVSLFEFNNFDYLKYNEEHPQSSVSTFVPKRKDADIGVWLEINRSEVADNLIDPFTLIHRWQVENKYGHNVMPYIESAHIGDIPIGCVKRVLIFKNDQFKTETN